MREFSKISPAVWGSERFNSLPSDDARYLYLYLLTCEHQTSGGTFKLKDGYATDDLKWDVHRYVTAREQLIEADLVRFDAAASIVLIARWFKHNCPMNESHFRGVEKLLLKLPSEALKQEALQSLQESYDALQVSRALAKGKLPVGQTNDLGPGLKGYAARNNLGFVQGGRT